MLRLPVSWFRSFQRAYGRLIAKVLCGSSSLDEVSPQRARFAVRYLRGAVIRTPFVVLLIALAVVNWTAAPPLLVWTIACIEAASAIGNYREAIRAIPYEPSSVIETAPGWRLRALLALVFGARVTERVFDQIVADAQSEWADATMAGRHSLARWIRLRANIHLVASVLAILLGFFLRVMGQVRRLWEPEE